MISPKSTLLQFNATIIAGLFILITIQGVVSDNGMFVFIDEITSQKIQKEYAIMMNDTNLDPQIREEAKKRFVEIELDSKKDLVKFNRDYETKTVKLFHHPTTYFLISLSFIVSSCVFIMYGKEEEDSRIKWGKGLTVIGLMMIIFSTFIILAL